MKKLWKGLVALFGFLLAVALASKARRYAQRADAVTAKQVDELSKSKQADLGKAAALGEKADKLLDKAAAAKTASEERAKQLENSDAKTLADRVTEFNQRL